MIDDRFDVEQRFYETVAELLECDDHSYLVPVPKRTRWNNRHPGNGRFPNHGIVRYFGPSHILVHLTNPSVHGLYHSAEDALGAIRDSL